MKVIGRNWKAVLSVLLLLVAVLVYVLGYRPRSEAYVMERDQLNAQITALQTTIVENEKYKDVQDQLEPAEAAIEESRAALYENFPADMKEEDQILYLLYLEKRWGPAVRSWATPRNCTIFSFSASGAAATSSFLSVRSRRCRP